MPDTTASTGREGPMAKSGRHPGNFSAFSAECMAAMQLARATAWGMVALLARNLAPRSSDPEAYERLARAAVRVASDRAAASVALARPDDGGLPQEYAPALAMLRTLAAGDPAPGAAGWLEGFPGSWNDFAPFQTCDRDLLDALQALEGLDNARPTVAEARVGKGLRDGRRRVGRFDPPFVFPQPRPQRFAFRSQLVASPFRFVGEVAEIEAILFQFGDARLEPGLVRRQDGFRFGMAEDPLPPLIRVLPQPRKLAGLQPLEFRAHVFPQIAQFAQSLGQWAFPRGRLGGAGMRGGVVRA